jgi:hypothetical protein
MSDENNLDAEIASKINRQLCIVRSDGLIFGAGEHKLSDLGFNVALTEIPPDNRLWSARGAKAFGKSELPDPCKVFNTSCCDS